MEHIHTRNPDELMRAILSRAPVGIAVIDYDGHYVSVNAAYSAIYGYAVPEMVGKNFLMVFPQTTHASVLARHQGFLDNGGSLGGEWSVLRNDGSRRTVWSESVAFPNDSGQSDRLVYVLDITNQKAAQEQERIAATVFETTSEAILVCDAENRIIAVNPTFTRLTGYAFADVAGKTPSIFRSEQHDDAFFADMWKGLNDTGLWSGEVWDRRRDGEAFLKEMTITVVKDAAGRVQNYVSVFTDITKRKSAEEIIRRQANYDAVTGLPNRHMFSERLAEGARRAEQNGCKLALLLIDLDHFKEINDTLGHTAGDRLLVEVSRLLQQGAGPDVTIARVGGDEFALILPSIPDACEAAAVAGDLMKRFEMPIQIGYESIYITASVGISLLPDHARSLEDLFKSADQALYAAKASGRNCMRFFTAALQEAASERARLANDLRRAIADKHLTVHYQPIIDLRTDRAVKAEALVRWQHSERGWVSPAAFIPIAEETGLIVPLGEFVARQAIAEVARCRRQFDPSFQITVNQSPVQFRNNDFTGIGWLNELAEHNLDGQAIGIEITEGLLLNAEPQVKSTLFAFRDAGIKVAIDDFGTGYSSLAYLRKFDIDTLKIDRSFVSDLDGVGLDICEAIIVMAHRLGLDVVAEGVETERQRDILKSIGCDYAQGFLYAPGLPAADLEAMLNRQMSEPTATGTVRQG